MEAEWRDTHESSGQWLGSILKWSKTWKMNVMGKEWRRDTGKREGGAQIMDIMNGNAMAREWCECNKTWRLSEIMLETGVVRSDVPESVRQAVKAKYAEAVEKGKKGASRAHLGEERGEA
jgi:hypothetical protein